MNFTQSKAAKLASGVVGIAMALSIVAPSLASADTASDLQAQINSLLATISSLQSQLSATTGSSSVSTGYVFNTNLTVGSKGTDVMNLQKVLNMSADTKVSVSGAGSPGMETSTFGPATKAAVMKFQTKYGISPVAGYVGAITRAKLNSMNTTTVPPVVTPGNPQGGSLSVSAGSQPANSLAPQSAARVPFTTVVLTAGSSDVTVNSITVERSGLAQDAVFSGVVLLNSDGTQIGTSKTLNSNHQAMVGEAFVVKAGTSKTVTIAGNMAADNSLKAGQVVGLNVVAVNTSASVSASLPITGAQHTINASLTLGLATLSTSSFDPGSGQSKEIGTTNYKFAGFRVQAGSAEQVKLWSVRFNQTGSASSNDLANVKVYVDGTAYDTMVSTDGKYYTASFAGGILIDKGLSKDIYIQGDIVGSNASGRTVIFDIYKSTDIYLSGVTYGYGITPTASGIAVPTRTTTSSSTFTTGTPFFFGVQISVTGGSATTIQKATSVAATNIAVNVPNQILGGFSTDIKGEPISVQGMDFYFNYSAGVTASSFLLTNVSLVDQNGAVVAGPVDATNVGGVAQKVSFTDTVTLPVGVRTLRLQGKIPSGTANNTTITASTTPSSWTNVQGQTTGNSIALTNGVFTMNTMTVRAAALAITVATTPSAQSIVAGGQGVTFANYQFDASQSGEDVRFSTIPLKITFAGGAAANNASSCQLFDGSSALNTGSNVVSPASSVSTAADVTFTLDQQFTVPKGTVKTLALKCNVSSGATGSMSWGIQASPSISVTGVTSSNDVTESVSASVGQTMTFGSASLVVTTDSNSPSYTTVAAGTTGVVIGAYKFTASNEDINLNRVALKLTNSASSTAADLVQVSIWDGGTQVGTATFTGNGAYATSTFNTPVVISKNTPKVLTVKADLAAVGSNLSGHEGALIAVDINGSDSTGTQGNGAASGAVVNASGSTSVAGVRMFKATPVFTYSNTSGVAQSGTNDLLVLNVTANGTGDVQMNKLTFAVSTTTANLTNPTFSGPNGSVGSVTLTSTTLTVSFDSVSNTADRTVAVGSTKTYTLRGDIALTGNTNTTGSVGVALKADTSYPSLSSLMGTVASLSASNIIWSPNSTSTAVSASDDWANGYGLGGCFATSGLGQNCFSRVLSK